MKLLITLRLTVKFKKRNYFNELNTLMNFYIILSTYNILYFTLYLSILYTINFLQWNLGISNLQ